jgi:hypothetical protein
MMAMRHPLLSSRTTPRKEVTTEVVVFRLSASTSPFLSHAVHQNRTKELLTRAGAPSRTQEKDLSNQNRILAPTQTSSSMRI